MAAAAAAAGAAAALPELWACTVSMKEGQSTKCDSNCRVKPVRVDYNKTEHRLLGVWGASGLLCALPLPFETVLHQQADSPAAATITCTVSVDTAWFQMRGDRLQPGPKTRATVEVKVGRVIDQRRGAIEAFADAFKSDPFDNLCLDWAAVPMVTVTVAAAAEPARLFHQGSSRGKQQVAAAVQPLRMMRTNEPVPFVPTRNFYSSNGTSVVKVQGSSGTTGASATERQRAAAASAVTQNRLKGAFVPMVRGGSAALPVARLPATSNTGDMLRQMRQHPGAVRSSLDAAPVAPSGATARAELVGLVNSGNSCYMNAVLQALVSLRALVDACEADGGQHASPARAAGAVALASASVPSFSASLVRLRAQLREKRSSVSGEAIKNIIGARHQRFAGNRQQDAHEFFTQCLDEMEEDYLRPRGLAHVAAAAKAAAKAAPPAVVDLAASDDESPSVLDPSPPSPAAAPEAPRSAERARKRAAALLRAPVSHMRCVIESTLTCVRCGDSRAVIEEFNNLSLDFPAPAAASASGRESAHSCRTHHGLDLLEVTVPSTKTRLLACPRFGGNHCSALCPEHKQFLSCRSSFWSCTTFGCKAGASDETLRSLVADAEKAGAAVVARRYRVEDLLDSFLACRTLEYKCEHCSEGREVEVKQVLRQLPRVLVLHLKRFYAGRLGMEKRGEPVAFPVLLDVSAHCGVDSVALVPLPPAAGSQAGSAAEDDAAAGDDRDAEASALLDRIAKEREGSVERKDLEQRLERLFKTAARPPEPKRARLSPLGPSPAKPAAAPAAAAAASSEGDEALQAALRASEAEERARTERARAADAEFARVLELSAAEAGGSAPLSPLLGASSGGLAVAGHTPAAPVAAAAAAAAAAAPMDQEEPLWRENGGAAASAPLSPLMSKRKAQDDENEARADPEPEPQGFSVGEGAVRYELRSIVCHRGLAASHGHYVTLVRGGEQEWRLHDDARVYESSQRDALGERAQREAYMLFYELRAKDGSA